MATFEQGWVITIIVVVIIVVTTNIVIFINYQCFERQMAIYLPNFELMLFRAYYMY